MSIMSAHELFDSPQICFFHIRINPQYARLEIGAVGFGGFGILQTKPFPKNKSICFCRCVIWWKVGIATRDIFFRLW
jgi:hypothetical protein